MSKSIEVVSFPVAEMMTKNIGCSMFEILCDSPLGLVLKWFLSLFNHGRKTEVLDPSLMLC